MVAAALSMTACAPSRNDLFVNAPSIKRAAWTPDGGFIGLDASIIITLAGCRDQDAQIAIGDQFWSHLEPGSLLGRERDALAVRFADGGRATFARFRRR